MYKTYFYQNSRGDSPVKDFILKLDKKSRSKIYQYLKLLQDCGPNLLRPYADKVRGKIRELRVKTKDGNIRIFYFFFIEKNIVLLHSLKKKTDQLPEREIVQAEKNMDDFIYQYKQKNIEL